MKKALLLLSVLIAAPVAADQYVKGHLKRDGTYVDGYQRTNPNSQRWDNYSSQGNVNPYTGQRGYERNEYSVPSYGTENYGTPKRRR